MARAKVSKGRAAGNGCSVSLPAFGYGVMEMDYFVRGRYIDGLQSIDGWWAMVSRNGSY